MKTPKPLQPLLLLLAGCAGGGSTPMPTPNLNPAEQEKSYQEATAAYDQRDYKRALALLRPLAQAGHSDAISRMGQMYIHGEGVTQNYATAKDWFEKLAANYPKGYWFIGRLYEKGGPGLEKDLAKACDYYRKSGDSWSWTSDVERICPSP